MTMYNLHFDISKSSNTNSEEMIDIPDASIHVLMNHGSAKAES